MSKRRSKSLTIVVIPDAGKKVRELRLPKWPLYAIPLVIIGLSLMLYLQHRYYEDSLRYADKLEQQLSAEQTASRQLLNEKQLMIETLQDKVLTLTQEAGTVRDKLEELEQLENDLRGLTAAASGDAKNASVQIASAEGEAPADHGEYAQDSVGVHPLLRYSGIGGAELPLGDADILALADDSATEFSSLFAELDQLKLQLQNTREDVLEYQHLLRITPSIWPAYSTTVTSNFGPRRDPFTREISDHNGIDIGGSYRDPILATADGTVVSASYDIYHGNNIVIDHTNGIRTWYMHMSKLLVGVGDKVQRGDQIGLMGSTGRSTGVHLHYEVLIDGKAVNPKPYMKTVWKDES